MPQIMSIARGIRLLGGALAGAVCATAIAAGPTLNVGSKRFTESYILGEILTQTAKSAGEADAIHRQGLGNTAIVLNALTSGSIDVYPEYTGTIAREILKLDTVPPLADLNARRRGTAILSGRQQWCIRWRARAFVLQSAEPAEA